MDAGEYLRGRVVEDRVYLFPKIIGRVGWCYVRLQVRQISCYCFGQLDPVFSVVPDLDCLVKSSAHTLKVSVG